MKHIKGGYNQLIVILTTFNALTHAQELYKTYIQDATDIDKFDSKVEADILCITLPTEDAKRKPTASFIKNHLSKIKELISKYAEKENKSLELIIVDQPEWFKIITKQSKTDSTLGSVLPDINMGSKAKVAFAPDMDRYYKEYNIYNRKIYFLKQSIINWLYFKNTEIISQIARANEFSQDWWIKEYNLEKTLEYLMSHKIISLDVETFSLKPETSGIISVAIAWSKFQGIAFNVDDISTKNKNKNVRRLLASFLEKYTASGGIILYHNASFDISVLIRQLWMDNIEDQEGLLKGIKILLGEKGEKFECTQIITWLATNSCIRTNLSLKELAKPFLGAWSIDKDWFKQKYLNYQNTISNQTLLEYNLNDTRATWWVYEKYKPILIRDNQKYVYDNIFKPSMLEVVQMQLTGVPLHYDKYLNTKRIIEKEKDTLYKNMLIHPIVKKFVYDLEEEAINKKNKTLKTKVVSRKDLGTIKALKIYFNPLSSVQIKTLLFDKRYCRLTFKRTTKKGTPSVDGDTLKYLYNDKSLENKKDILELLRLIMEWHYRVGVLKFFITSTENLFGDHNICYTHKHLMGNFNIGGTLSGRMSSSNPNLQNIPSSAPEPSKKRLAKMIKSCISAPHGWLIAGMDFDSLEDKISALVTKDPNKLKVYIDGYDGHCLRTFEYFKEQMPDINPDLIESINSIKDKYPVLRQKSKAPTFTLTYQGTNFSLVKDCGFSEKQAKIIEQRYHDLYKVSDLYIENRLQEAHRTGYVNLAFGLRLRTPALNAVATRHSKHTTKEALEEERTAGNAIGQSWGMLNNRSASAFMKKVRSHNIMKNYIKPFMHVHDSQYFLIKNNIKVVKYINDNLIKEAEWQEHPLIKHDKVKITATLEIFYPDLTTGIKLPPAGSSEEEIAKIVKENLI